MKFLILFSIVSSLIVSLNAQFPDLCAWQRSRDDVISKLTPQGQVTMAQILRDLQTAVGVAVQPIYQQVRAQYPNLISQLEQSDNQNFQTFLNFLGYGNPNCGSGPLADLCQVTNSGTTLFNNFKLENQHAVLTLLQAIVTRVISTVPVIEALVAYHDSALVTKLETSESSENLAALGKIMGYNV